MKLFASLLIASMLSAPTFGQGLINRRAPSFSLPDSNYTQFDILDYRGKWLLIGFMMTSETNCPMCKDLMKKLDALQTKHGPKLAVLGIAQTPQDNQDTVKKFIAETKTKIPIVFDYSLVGIAYFKATPTRPAMDIPHVFAVDPSGTIVRDWTLSLILGPGFSTDVDKLIAGGSPANAEPAAKAKAKAK
jgi:peroxiredoxin